jgi:hypothetical protein
LSELAVLDRTYGTHLEAVGGEPSVVNGSGNYDRQALASPSPVSSFTTTRRLATSIASRIGYLLSVIGYCIGALIHL